MCRVIADDPFDLTAGEKLSLALVGQAPVAGIAGVTAGADAGIGWWSDIQTDFFRKACDQAGKYLYTPLYTMKRQIGWTRRLFREDEEPEDQHVHGDDLCVMLSSCARIWMD